MDQLVKIGYQAITFLGRSRVTHGRLVHEARSMCGIDLHVKEAYQAADEIDCSRCIRIMVRKRNQGRILEYVE